MTSTQAEEASIKVDTVAVALVHAAGSAARAGETAAVSDAAGSTKGDAGAGHYPYVAQ